MAIKSIDLERSSSDYLSDGNAFQFTGDHTIEFWIKFETAMTSTSSTWHGIVDKWVGTGNQRAYEYYFRNDGANDRLQYQLSTDGTGTSSGGQLDLGTTFSTGTWYHFAIVYDADGDSGNGQLTVYQGTEGSADTQIAQVGGLVTSIFASDASIIFNSDSGGQFFMDGLWNNVRLWSSVRTLSEINTNRFSELVGTETNLEAYYKFNDDLLDETSNNIDLTHSGTATYSSDIPSSPILIDVSDTINLSESITTVKKMITTVTDTINLSETISLAKQIMVTVSDTLN